MFKMRLNIKKWTAISIILLVLWFVVSFSSVLDVPKSGNQNYVAEIENRIEKLQKEMEKEMSKSNILLDKIKNHLRKKPQDVSKEELLNMPKPSNPVLPVLVIACDRVTVKRCLDNLIKYRPNKEIFPIIVSQDCGHNETYRAITSYTKIDPTITVVRQPDLSEIELPKSKAKFRGYYNIARHYKFALHHTLVTRGHEAVIIVEDDLDVSPDFFEYFLGTYPLLKKDPSLWCISAWNDNGKKELIDLGSPELLHRTDFFPGLGWMMRREMWLNLEPKWPEAFFDDWLRDPHNTDSRACIRPEISRTFSFGKVGVSKGLFFDMHLRYIHLNEKFVPFTKLDLSYLLKDTYDVDLEKTISSLPAMSADEVVALPRANPSTDKKSTAVRVAYTNAKSFQRAAKKLGLMDDFRSNIPRTAYRGVVTCFIKGRRIYIVPSYPWIQYDGRERVVV